MGTALTDYVRLRSFFGVIGLRSASGILVIKGAA